VRKIPEIFTNRNHWTVNTAEMHTISEKLTNCNFCKIKSQRYLEVNSYFDSEYHAKDLVRCVC